MSAAALAAAAALTERERNAVRASAVRVPRYRDMGQMQARLVELGLAQLVDGGAELTDFGQAVRAELGEKRK